MTQSDCSDTNHHRFTARIGSALGLLLTVGLLFTAPASAAGFEQVQTFAGGGVSSPLYEATGMAVNTTGAGGVPAGTVYTVTWKGKLVRSGPKGEVIGQTVVGGNALAVAVNQVTGYVYVLCKGDPGVVVFDPDGSGPIENFGEQAAAGPIHETVDESPEKFHLTRGIAVDDSGSVYVSDLGFAEAFEVGGQQSRAMVFEPQGPGEAENYAYTGRANDIAASSGAVSYDPGKLALDSAGNLYTAGEDSIYRFSLDDPLAPTCEFKLPAGGINGMTVNPETGEVFYASYKDGKGHQLSCNVEGEFVESAAFAIKPKPTSTFFIEAWAFSPSVTYEPLRPAGVLYAASSYGGLGYIFAAPIEVPPLVESESLLRATSTTATLGAKINPKGTATRYVFQYLDNAAYEANEPNERQALTVSAGGGVFGLGFGAHRFGGPATANLTAGSKTATALQTVKATATLKAAKGSGNVAGGVGKGTLIAGSTTITSVSTGEGKFEVGQGIRGEGIFSTNDKGQSIPVTITAVKAEAGLSTEEITISAPATKSGAHVGLSAGSSTVTGLSTSEGSFEVGQAISGEKVMPKTITTVPPNTTITAVKAGELTLSKPASGPATGMELQAGSPTLTALSNSMGSFESGQAVEGEGIPDGTTITDVKATELTLSKPASKPGTGVAILSPGPDPLAVGERIEGPGIPPDTTIAAAKAGELTLSNPASASGTGVSLQAGLPADVSAAGLRRALEALSTIGAENVEVSGGPGDEAGTDPYEITFTGAFENTDVEELSADDSALSGGAATATVQTENDGGGGFAGATEAPLGGADLGSGQSALSATVSLNGLVPDTAYRYRAIATSHCSAIDAAKVCEGIGASQAFHTAPLEAPKLPDDRAWELVSPAQKHGGEVFPADSTISSCGPQCKPGAFLARFAMQSSPDGEAVVYTGFPFSHEEGAIQENEYLSRRTASGWQTTTLSPSLQGSGDAQGHKAFNAELTKGLLYQLSPALSPEAPSEFANLYSQDTADPSQLSPLLSGEPPNRPAGGASFKLIYAGASADFSRLFFAANDALSGETPFAPEAVDGGAAKYNLYEWAEGQLRLVNVAPGNAETAPGAAFGAPQKGNFNAVLSHAISEDGSRVFWTSEAGQVYVRENGESTAAIPGAGKFLTASADGSKVLLDNGQLFNVEDLAEAPLDLTQGAGGFEGISGQSEDLSRVYFVDTAVLAGENAEGAAPVAGKDNLYLWSEGTASFLATLLPKDGQESIPRGDWAPAPAQRTAQASPDGRWLAFISEARLTGYDNTGPCTVISETGKFVPGPCREVFIYDSLTAKLICASCNPSGARPLGPSTLRLMTSSASAASFPQPRYLTDSGRLYFDSQDSLTPFDTNDGVEDVYQYEPNGVGSCKREAGCVSLISAGHEPIDSNFLATDPQGKSVFFTSRDQLVLKDRDELVDLYVAREGGGIAAESEAGRTECQGEACVPALSPPNDPTPASSSVNGAGNVDERKASKKHKKKKKKHAKKKAHKRAAKHNRGGSK